MITAPVGQDSTTLDDPQPATSAASRRGAPGTGRSATAAAAAAPAAVTVDAVRKSYGERQVLRGISLEIRGGEVFGILGPNGAGKTTLVECIVGLRRPDAGGIEVLGLDPLRDRHAFTARVSVQPQDANLFESIRVREAVDLFASMYTDPLASDDVIAQIGLTDSADQLVRKLSGGQRRRLLLGVAMVGGTDLIILDEPSAGLDPQARRGLWAVIERLRGAGKTVLLTTHHMDEATTLCDRVGFVVAGELVALGTPAELVHQLAAEQAVSFETEVSDVSSIVSSLRDRPEVLAVDLEAAGRGHRVTVRTSDSDRVLSLVAGSADWGARAITVDQGDLENVFLSVAGGGAASDHQSDHQTDHQSDHESDQRGRHGRRARKERRR